MTEYLFRISLEFDWSFNGKDRSPLYVVARDKKSAKEYAEKHLKRGATVKSVNLLGERLGMNMYYGKPKK